jgi:hypothetical protein
MHSLTHPRWTKSDSAFQQGSRWYVPVVELETCWSIGPRLVIVSSRVSSNSSIMGAPLKHQSPDCICFHVNVVPGLVSDSSSLQLCQDILSCFWKQALLCELAIWTRFIPHWKKICPGEWYYLRLEYYPGIFQKDYSFEGCFKVPKHDRSSSFMSLFCHRLPVNKNILTLVQQLFSEAC